MRCRPVGFHRWVVPVALVAGFVAFGAPRAFAQNQPNQPAVAGIVVDAQGTLIRKTYVDPTGQLTRERIAAAQSALSPEVARPSTLRKISLNRLEAAIKARNGVPTEEMRYLAGLLRVRYVFVYPESGDLVIAGPAEGWVTDISGRVVGIKSGRPVVQLQDLVVALRAFPPDGKPTEMVGCSIDPTEHGLAQMQQFLNRVGRTLVPGQEQAMAQYLVTNLQAALGLQQISISGIPADTHFAHVMVEADYRMKLIGIGLERPPVRMVSFIDKVNPAAVSRNALFRWYFVPDYQCVRASKDGLAMELVGDGVKVVGENELVTSSGQRRAVSRANYASQAFTASFTRSYPELARRSPVFAELRNLIDLLVAAAYIRQHDLYNVVGWKMELFGDEQAFSVRTYPAPKQVASAVNAVFKRAHLMTPIGGGVEIRPEQALKAENLLPDEKGRVADLRKGIHLPEGRWWWD